MSVHVSSWVWKHSKAQGSDLVLLLALADIANEEGAAYPNIRTLALRCRCSERSVYRLLAALRDTGQITVENRSSEHMTCIYRIVTDDRGGPATDGSYPSANSGNSYNRRTVSNELPPTPNGAKAPEAVSLSARKKRLAPEIIASLEMELFLSNHSGFQAAFRRWFDYKVGRAGAKVTVQALQLDLKKLASYPKVEQAIEAIDFAIQACWMAVGPYRKTQSSPQEKKPIEIRI